MAHISRNALCPCGSGKKFKRCCANKKSPAPRTFQWVVETDPLDDLSNQIPACIEAGNLTEAEALCQTLKERYPDALDWRERYAEVYEAQGRLQHAAAHYRLAAELAATTPGCDGAYVQSLRSKAERLSQLADQV